MYYVLLGINIISKRYCKRRVHSFCHIYRVDKYCNKNIIKNFIVFDWV
jgi:hypothetical protein